MVSHVAFPAVFFLKQDNDCVGAEDVTIFSKVERQYRESVLHTKSMFIHVLHAWAIKIHKPEKCGNNLV